MASVVGIAMGRQASPLLVAETGPVLFVAVAGGEALIGAAGLCVVVVAVVVGLTGVLVVSVAVGLTGVPVVAVEVWPEVVVVAAPVAIPLGDAALLEELLEPQPSSTNTKHAI